MSSLTQAEIKNHLIASTNTGARVYKYLGRLGLRKKSKSKSSSGRPVFSGEIKAFYEATKAAAHGLSTKYNSLMELQEQIKTQDPFSEELIDDILNGHGPLIWSDGGSGFLTVIDDRVDDGAELYPRHLIYNNESDRASIRTFVYCLTLEGTSRKMRKMGIPSIDDAVIHMELPYEARRRPRFEDSDVMGPDPDIVSAESPTYQVPVAGMVPGVDAKDTTSSSVTPHPGTSRVSLTTMNSVMSTEEHYQPSEQSHSGTAHLPAHFPKQASNTNSEQGEGTGQWSTLRKRKRSLHGSAVDTDPPLLELSEFTSRIVRPRRTEALHRMSRRILSSPLLDTTENLEHEGTSHKSPDRATRHYTKGVASTCQYSTSTRTNHDSDNDAIAVTSTRNQHHHIPAPGIPTSGRRVDEFDSVVGSPRRSLELEEQEEEKDREPTLIVKLRVKTKKQVAQRHRYRRCIAAKLTKAFEMSSRQQNVLEEVVTLIKDIRELERPLSQSGSGYRHAPYELILDQRLSLVDIYLRFCKETNFYDDVSTWGVHRDSLDVAERLERDAIFDTASLDIYDWCDSNGKYETYEWSRCATISLLEMTERKWALKTEDVEEVRRRFVKFNERLVGWFTY